MSCSSLPVVAGDFDCEEVDLKSVFEVHLRGSWITGLRLGVTDGTLPFTSLSGGQNNDRRSWLRLSRTDGVGASWFRRGTSLTDMGRRRIPLVSCLGVAITWSWAVPRAGGNTEEDTERCLRLILADVAELVTAGNTSAHVSRWSTRLLGLELTAACWSSDSSCLVFRFIIRPWRLPDGGLRASGCTTQVLEANMDDQAWAEADPDWISDVIELVKFRSLRAMSSNVSVDCVLRLLVGGTPPTRQRPLECHASR